MTIMSHDRVDAHPSDVYGGEFWDDPAAVQVSADLMRRNIDPVAHRKQITAAFLSMLSGRLVAQTYAALLTGTGAKDRHLIIGKGDNVIPWDLASNLAIGSGVHAQVFPREGHLFAVTDVIGTAERVGNILEDKIAA